jgi:hypothetical protein
MLDESVLTTLLADARATAATSPSEAADAAWETLGLVLDQVEPALNVRNLRIAVSAVSPWRRATPELVNRGISTSLAADIAALVGMHDYSQIAVNGPQGQQVAESLVDATEPVALALNAAIPTMVPGVGLWDAATLQIITP